jgi:hypothetical protein
LKEDLLKMRIHAITTGAPANIQAAFAGPEMRGVGAILRKIESGISYNDFPISIAELDQKLSGAGLKTSERIALKAAMSRAGLLK